MAGLAGRSRIAEGLLHGGLVSTGSHLAEIVGGRDKLLGHLANLLLVLEKLWFHAGLDVADIFIGPWSKQGAHAGVSDTRNGIGGGFNLFGVKLTLQVGLDLAHVPAHEAVTGLTDLDLLLGFDLSNGGGGQGQGDDSENKGFFHDFPLG